MVKNPPANATASGLISDAGRSHLLHAEQLSTTTLESVPRAWEWQLLKPACPRVYAPQQEKPPQREAHTQQSESGPRLPQLEEKTCTATKTQHSQK